MMNSPRHILTILLCIATGLSPYVSAAIPGDNLSTQETLNDQSTGRNWAGYGRTNGQQHFSPLQQFNRDNIDALGLAWSMDLAPANSVTEPVAVDGILYFATGLSVVHAVDAATGKELWQYDPKVGEVGGLNLRQGWGVRGVAWWNGMVYVGTQDGRLIALNAKQGKRVWTAQTVRAEDAAHVNGAPRVFNGKVLIGFAGTTGAIRGYVTAYDGKTGKQLWRFWTVPGNPAKGFENKAMEMAAETWSGEWWKNGGGATVWNSMAYDIETDTAYIGTGSGYPWNHRIRSAGKGDNLFVSSIVALNATTGEHKWHYQVTPGETWDFDATMDIELADIEIDGRIRKVLMQAPKNGFFYVIDRNTGELISAEPYVKVSWASHIDKVSGRPVETPGSRFPDGKVVRLRPGTLGAHSWMPMAYSPQTNLVYIPAINLEMDFSDIKYDWKPSADRSVDGGLSLAAGPYAGMKPPSGSLLAWSPRDQKPVWQVEYPTFLNGGILATAGKLVFQGSVDGLLKAYAADTGELLWQFDAKAPILAAPISYAVEGSQYLTVLTGSGMGVAMFAGMMVGPTVERYAIDPQSQARRVLTFAIDGKATLPTGRNAASPPEDPDFKPDQAKITLGMTAFFTYCVTCHGAMAVGIGNGPDLRRSAMPLNREAFDQIVRNGILEARGMPRFPELDNDKLEGIRHYIRSRAAELRDQESTGEVTPLPASIGM